MAFTAVVQPHLSEMDKQDFPVDGTNNPGHFAGQVFSRERGNADYPTG